MEKLIEETIESYYSYIRKLAPGCQLISDQLRTENESEAFKNIIDFIDGVEWMANVEFLMKKNGFYIPSSMEKAKDFIGEINDALEKRDYVYVADLFEYELQPLFEAQSHEQFTHM